MRQGDRDSAPSIGPRCRLRQTHGPSGIELRWRLDVLAYSNFVSPWFAQVLGLWAGFVAVVQDLLPGDFVFSEVDPRLDDSIPCPTRSWLQGESMTPFPGGCTTRSRLVGHAVVQRANGPPSCGRSVYKDGGRRSAKFHVKFSDVAFWFPATRQLHLPAARAPAINKAAFGQTGHHHSGRCIGPVIPDTPASVTSAVQGGSCRSLQQRQQIGPPVPAVQGGSCRSLQPHFLPQDSPAEWPCLVPFPILGLPLAQATSLRVGASSHSPLVGAGRQTPVPGHNMPAAMSGVSSRPTVGLQAEDRSRHPYTSFDAVMTSRTRGWLARMEVRDCCHYHFFPTWESLGQNIAAPSSWFPFPAGCHHDCASF